MTDAEIRELLAASPEEIETDDTGFAYNPYFSPTTECRRAYVAFRATVASLIAERDQLRADLREACEIGLCIAEVPEERKRLAELREKAGDP